MRKLAAAMAIIFFYNIHALHAQHIPAPKQHFGFNIGDDYQLATYTQTEAYFRKLAAASDRVRLVEIGKTEEGRTQLMLIVSSPKNIRDLDRYKTVSQQLAHAEGLTDEQAHALAAKGKAVVWIDGGLHATETVGTHQLIETAWQLISRKDPETLQILDNVIILLTHDNPDGQELVSSWYMRNPVPEKRSLENVPRLYEKYAGHDNNRDFFMLNLKETQNIGRQLFIEWLPQIMYNHHQTGPAGSVLAGPPYRDPFNYVFDPLILTSIDAVGAAMNNRLNVEGKPGYTQRSGSVFSTWYNGGLRTTTYFHNMIGLLTEIIGSPTPATVPLIPQRLIPNSATPNPITPQPWHFRQSIDYSVSLNYAVLDYAVRYRDELLYNMYRMGLNSIQRGQKDYWTLSPKRIAAIEQLYRDAPRERRSPRADSAAGEPEDSNAIPVKYYDSILKDPALRDARGYIIPDQPDNATAIRFINALINTGIVVYQATDDFSVSGASYKKGSWIIKTDQAFRPHILDMFEPQDHPNDFQYPGGPPIPPYDAAGWTLAYQMGIKFQRILDPFDGPFRRIPYGEEQHPKKTFTAAAPSGGFILDARANQSFTVANDLLKQGIGVHRVTDAATALPGSFYIPNTPHAIAALTASIASTGAEASLLAQAPNPASLSPIRPARIALWDTYGGSLPSGWIRWIAEQYHFPVEVIYPKDIDSVDLHARFDLIIFVSGAIPPLPTPGATMPGRGRFGGRQPKPEDIPEEYRSHLGRITADKSIPRLRKFLEEGGNIVTIGASTNLAYHLGLPVQDALTELVGGKERKLPGEKFYVPGSVLQVSVDSTQPAAWGMSGKADIYFEQSPVFNISPAAYTSGQIRPIAWFATDKPLRSGWAWGQAYLRNGIAAFVATVGKGKLYAFGPEITFRAQTHGAFKFLFNEMYVPADPQ
ncbi:M14 family metallopeptidase [Flavitalea sp. BT771]|uniref:M14 family metallopeptidase n=1 Tax=Flavitalea sp. BT771 TaxID=3063329 RepID=UPI0026E1962C|nr:M14 metallopeptidase family protein [Flavitalea sp. BT771]MDO6434868.1 M14 family metallopeptidase [Flavitalea sp. BT771]MDV6223768.1 M14 family metallopeptidase [Flavitalea sp. BT771]